MNAGLKVWWIEYAVTVNGGRAYVSGVEACRMDGRRKISASGAEALREALDKLTNEGAIFVFCWEFSLFGAFLDTYAYSHGIKAYEEAEKRGNTRRKRYPKEPCFSAFYTAGHGVTNVRFTLPRTALTHSFRGGKVGGLHTVEYRGLSRFFQGHTREEVESYFTDASGDPAERGAKVLKAFFERFSQVVGEDVATVAYLRRVYTLGGAARRVYLRIKYGTGTLARYQKEHFADHDADDYLRARHLQLGGAIFYNERLKGELIEKHLIHYDVNGLYSATANRCGELSFPREVEPKLFQTDRDPARTYIIVLRDVVAYRKPNLPAAFMDPVGTSSGEVIWHQGEWAMFRELFEALKLYYDFEEFEVVKVLQCQIRHDPAMVDYNARFEQLKERAGAEKDGILRALAKGMLNNLIGKMTQRTGYYEILPSYNKERDEVEFTTGEYVDDWDRHHFDYIRGAYIYTMARVRIMTDIYHWLGKEPRSHHFYTDTDSIVTDVRLPEDMVDSLRLGYYKIEREYTHFSVLAKKVYYGRTVDGEDHVTCAGITKGTILREIRDAYGEDLPPEKIHAILTSGARFPVDREIRTRGGAMLETVFIGLQEIDIDNVKIV